MSEMKTYIQKYPVHRCTTISAEDQTRPSYRLAHPMRSMIVKLYALLCAYDKNS